MAQFDFGAHFGVSYAGTNDAAASVTSAPIDLQGFNGVGVVTITDGDFDASSASATFFESDTDQFGDATEVDSTRVKSNPDPDKDSTAFKARVTPIKRYLFVQYAFGGSPAGTVTTVGILGFPGEVPVE